MMNLEFFTGSENLYKHQLSTLKYTDGVKYVADTVGAYWLIDAIGSYQHTKAMRDNEFQTWELSYEGRLDYYKLLATDGNGKVLIKQKIESSDFPKDGIKMFVSHGVLMLPSEY